MTATHITSKPFSDSAQIKFSVTQHQVYYHTRDYKSYCLLYTVVNYFDDNGKIKDQIRYFVKLNKSNKIEIVIYNDEFRRMKKLAKMDPYFERWLIDNIYDNRIDAWDAKWLPPSDEIFTLYELNHKELGLLSEANEHLHTSNTWRDGLRRTVTSDGKTVMEIRKKTESQLDHSSACAFFQDEYIAIAGNYTLLVGSLEFSRIIKSSQKFKFLVYDMFGPQIFGNIYSIVPKQSIVVWMNDEELKCHKCRKDREPLTSLVSLVMVQEREGLETVIKIFSEDLHRFVRMLRHGNFTATQKKDFESAHVEIISTEKELSNHSRMKDLKKYEEQLTNLLPGIKPPEFRPNTVDKPGRAHYTKFLQLGKASHHRQEASINPQGPDEFAPSDFEEIAFF